MKQKSEKFRFREENTASHNPFFMLETIKFFFLRFYIFQYTNFIGAASKQPHLDNTIHVHCQYLGHNLANLQSLQLSKISIIFILFHSCINFFFYWWMNLGITIWRQWKRKRTIKTTRKIVVYFQRFVLVGKLLEFRKTG